VRRVITAATVAVALVVFSHGHSSGTPAAARTRPAPTAPVTAPHASTTSSPAKTHPEGRRPKPAVRPEVTTSTVTTVIAKHRPTTARVTTTTSNLMEIAVVRERALQTCLELASANKFRTIAANNTWYQQQLQRIAARGKKANALLQVLLAQENQTRDLIDAQLTIDESNCYIKYA
jgi:hypothetical protein